MCFKRSSNLGAIQPESVKRIVGSTNGSQYDGLLVFMTHVTQGFKIGFVQHVSNDGSAGHSLYVAVIFGGLSIACSRHLIVHVVVSVPHGNTQKVYRVN